MRVTKENTDLIVKNLTSEGSKARASYISLMSLDISLKQEKIDVLEKIFAMFLECLETDVDEVSRLRYKQKIYGLLDNSGYFSKIGENEND